MIPEVGKRYRVEWDDCCAAGEFEAEVSEVTLDEDEELEAVRFVNGVVLRNPLWGVTFEEVS